MRYLQGALAPLPRSRPPQANASGVSGEPHLASLEGSMTLLGRLAFRLRFCWVYAAAWRA